MAGPWERSSPALALPACADPGWPRLADGALLLCVEGEGVDLVVPLDGRPPFALGTSVRRPAVGGGALVAPALRDGTWSMKDGTRSASSWLAGRLVAAPVTDGATLGAAWEGDVARFELGARSWSMIDAHPAPGQPLALAGGQLWWSELDDDGGLDLWTLDAADSPRRVEGGPGDQGLPAGDAERLVYLDRGDVVIRPVLGGEERVTAHAGVAAPPALDGARTCWEERPDRVSWAPGGPGAGEAGRGSDGAGTRSGEPRRAARWIRCHPDGSVEAPVALHDPSMSAGALLVHGDGRSWLLGTEAQVAAVQAAVDRLP